VRPLFFIRDGRKIAMPKPISQPGLSHLFRGATPAPWAGRNAHAMPASSPLASARLVLPPRLIVPASAATKPSLWTFRTPKLQFPND
jgi:hypothetical protein